MVKCLFIKLHNFIVIIFYRQSYRVFHNLLPFCLSHSINPLDSSQYETPTHAQSNQSMQHQTHSPIFLVYHQLNDSYVIHTIRKYFRAAIIASSFSGGHFGCMASSDFALYNFLSLLYHISSLPAQYRDY